uniref:Protein kinase domain-containing protein n=1 Tax=Panagrolaimus sp. JU765 TaxID=591449 RepID=A0AC34RPX8_9BILA
MAIKSAAAAAFILDYVVVKRLGEGNFSNVYAVVHNKFQKVAALKQVDLSEMDESEVDQAFNEIELLKMCESPHVIRLLDAFGIVEKKTLCVVLELMDDGDLHQCIEKARKNKKLFSEPTIWNFLHQICAGLHDLHTVNIIHRDLKPANVFLNKKGVVKIGDLGLSKLLSSENEKVTDSLGTEFYMTPERHGDDGYGFESDIWSLGCITYELCTL